MRECARAIGQAVDDLEDKGASPKHIGVSLALILCAHALDNGLTTAQLLRTVETTMKHAKATHGLLRKHEAEGGN